MVDWEGIERSERFRELVHKRRSFVVPATIFFLAYYMGFILLAGYAPDFMGKSVYEGLTVGYCLALTQFVMVFVLGAWYLRKADREFDPLADRVAAKTTAGEARFERPEGEREEVVVAKVAAFGIGVIAMVIAIIGGSGLNVSFMVGLAFAVAASANFPALLLALTWRRFNTAGAVTGVIFGVVSSIFLVIVSPKVWPEADTDTGSPIGWTLSNPGIVSIPLGFLGCWLGTMLSTERKAERTFDELFVRSETGIGAERAVELTH